MKTTLSNEFIEMIKLHEGYRDRVYVDTTGNRTIGYGWNLSQPICKEAAEAQLMHQLKDAEAQVRKHINFFDNLSQARQEVLIEMCFNMGIDTLLTFKNTLRLMEASNHEKAADQMLRSLWAQQVGQRAKTLAKKYRNG